MTRDEALAQYRAMLLIRRFEERCAQIYVEGKIGGFLHLYIGQEAVAVAAMSLLRPDDYFVTSYRDHGYALARGTDPRPLMAELCGKIGGISRGKGGSMHFYDVPTGNFGGDGIVGGHLPLAAGMGYAIRLRQTEQVRALLLRRRRGQRGRVPRGAQRELALEPARRLRHREQPLRHGHLARPGLVGEGPLPARQRLRHSAARRGRDGPPDGERSARRGDRPRAQGQAPHARSRSRPTATAGTRCPTPASTGPRRRSRR